MQMKLALWSATCLTLLAGYADSSLVAETTAEETGLPGACNWSNSGDTYSAVCLGVTSQCEFNETWEQTCYNLYSVGYLLYQWPAGLHSPQASCTYLGSFDSWSFSCTWQGSVE
jgi:hypothetical protein